MHHKMLSQHAPVSTRPMQIRVMLTQHFVTSGFVLLHPIMAIPVPMCRQKFYQLKVWIDSDLASPFQEIQ